MDSKIVLAFVVGALLASGIVYLAVKPEPGPTRVAAAAPARTIPVPTAQSSPVEASDAESAPLEDITERSVPPRAIRKTKPSPLAHPHTEVARVIRPVVPAPPELPRLTNPQRPPGEVSPGAATTSPAEQQVASIPSASAPPPEPAPAQPSAPEPHSVTLNSGTLIAVRVGETISTQKNQPGDTFLATLSRPLVADGFVIAERGARAECRIVEAERAGKVKGVSHLSVELTKITTSDGQHVRVRTASFAKQGQTSTGTDAAKVGIGSVLGAAIGAIAGGGKGAAIGAGAGGAAGAGDVLLTRGKDAVIPVETKLSFSLQEPVTITEQQR